MGGGAFDLKIGVWSIIIRPDLLIFQFKIEFNEKTIFAVTPPGGGAEPLSQ